MNQVRDETRRGRTGERRKGEEYIENDFAVFGLTIST